MSNDIDLDRARSTALLESSRMINALFISGWKKFDDKKTALILTQNFFAFLVEDRLDGSDLSLREAAVSAEVIRMGGFLKGYELSEYADQCKEEMKIERVLARVEENLQVLLNLEPRLPVPTQPKQGGRR